VLQTLGSFISGFVTAMLAKPFGEWLVRPRLEIELVDGPESLAFTPEVDNNTGKVAGHACYIRLAIRHRKGKLARGVQCFLTRIDFRLEGEDQFGPAPYVDMQELAWASRGIDERWSPMLLQRGTSRFLDVIATSTRHSPTFLIQTKLRPIREIAVGALPGTWRFTVLVAGENVSPRQFTFEMDWKNIWNDFELRAPGMVVSAQRSYDLTGSAFKPNGTQ
jgi:hypothetical protein